MVVLSVFFGFDEKADVAPDEMFIHNYDEAWFDDEIVRKMVQDIDNTVVQSRYCMLSPVLGQIPPAMLSGGVLGLILLYKTEWYYPDLINYGENCEGWLSWIFESRDIVKVSCSGFDLQFLGGIRGVCENDGTQIRNSDDWALKMGQYVTECKR